MSKLIQEKRVLTFEELCPDWTKIISLHGGFSETRDDIGCMKENNKRNLTNHKCCVVGEAHGGGSYWPFCGEPGIKCYACIRFSMDFFGYHDEEYYEMKKTEFVQHFNEVHVK